MATPNPSSTRRGWSYDRANGRMGVVYNDTEVLDFDANDIAFAIAPTYNADLVVANGSGAVIGNSSQLTVNALVPELQV